MGPVNLAVCGEKPPSPLGVEMFDARYSTKEVRTVVGMVAPVLGLGSMTHSIVEDGLELVILASVNIGTVVHDQTRQSLAL
jgi:hypothetical protein